MTQKESAVAPSKARVKKRVPKMAKVVPMPLPQKDSAQKMLLMVPISTYGSPEQLHQTAHRVVKQLAVFLHSEMSGITPTGGQITYGSDGVLVSEEL